MANLPTDVANEVLDCIGVDFTLGDISEGTRPAQVLLRKYSQCRRQMLRAAHWQWARREIPLMLLADITGNTPNVGTNVVQAGFIYEYAMPNDYLKAWYVPWQPFTTPLTVPGNIQPANPTAPLMTGLGQPPYTAWRPQPARFLICTDANFPTPPGIPGDDEVAPGTSPSTRTVLLTNVQNATFVYTADIIYPSIWDPLFRAALVAYLGSEVALALHTDKKLGIAIRDDQIKITKAKVQEARLADGNDQVSDSTVATNWMQVRRSGGFGGVNGGWGGDGGGGYGQFWGAGNWDTISFSNGGSF